MLRLASRLTPCIRVFEHSKKNRAQFHRQKIHSECGVSAKTIVYLIQQFHLGNNFISPARRGWIYIWSRTRHARVRKPCTYAQHVVGVGG
jgi:hypothetical protein